MKKIKNSIYLTFLGLAMVLISSCNLDETFYSQLDNNEVDIRIDNLPEPELGPETLPSGALSGAYLKLNAGAAGHNGYWSVQSVSTDEMCVAQKGGDWFDGGIWLNMHRHTYTPTSGPIQNSFLNQYEGIAEVNGLIPNATGAELAQLRVIRAYFYWRLIDQFGRVKIVTETATNPSQATRAEVFNFIESELLAVLGISAVSADMDLSSANLAMTNESIYQANIYTALGLLSRLYLNAEVYAGEAKYQEAIDVSDYIIENGSYSISGSDVSVPNLAKLDLDIEGLYNPDNLVGYPAIFSPNNYNNPEIIFALFYRNGVSNGMNFAQMSLSYASQDTFQLQAQPWNGYQALQEMYESYSNDDVRKNSNFVAGIQYTASGAPVLDFAADDPIDSSNSGEVEIVLNYKAAINELEPNAYRDSGTRLYKFSFRQFQRNDMDNKFPLVRLGEIYANRGEARARLSGDWNMAIPDFNILRERAGVAPYTSLDSEEALTERGREFFQEGLRRTDLIRFGAYNRAWWEKPVSPAHTTLFPIPQSQIQASNGTLTQNPGY